MAVKKLNRINDKKSDEAFRREAAILKGCRNPYIVNFMGVCKDEVRTSPDHADPSAELNWVQGLCRAVVGEEAPETPPLAVSRGLRLLCCEQSLRSFCVLMSTTAVCRLGGSAW